MSQIDAEEDKLGEAKAGEDEGSSSRLVPVTESIRYRKRAQGAEKKAETLAEQLADARSQVSSMAEELSDARVEKELTGKLAAAGTVDIEAAILVAKARMEGKAAADIDSVIEKLKKEKRYLFAETGVATAAEKTSGAKDRIASNETVLERAAKRAAVTGNRTDLQEYLKLRRDFV